MTSISDTNAHSSRGWKIFLESPEIFNFWQRITGAEKWKRRIIREYVKPFERARIFDLGCGTGTMLKHFDRNLNLGYVGCDINRDYIGHANKKFKGRGKFYCCGVDSLPDEESGFDFIIAIAIFHHLDDKTSLQLIDSVKCKLNLKGIFLIAEPVWTENQSGIEKYLMRNDRGKNIKTENEYILMVKEKFYSVESMIISDSHYIPWSVNVIICKNIS